MNRLFVAVALACAAIVRADETPSVLKDVAYLEPGRTEKLDLYLPARAPDDPPAPAVVWIHGGGWMTGDKAAAREQEVCPFLAGAGYVCASVNYQLGANSWPQNLYDCKNAVRFLRAHAADYHVDPDRIAVMGGSAGGHLALMVGLTADEDELEPKTPYPNQPDDVSAIGDFYGITDLLTRQNVSPEGKPLGTLKEGMEKPFGKTRTEDPKLWRLASPVSHVHPDSPPVLIVQGLADPILDYRQSPELDRALTLQGVPHRMILLEHVGHQFNFETWNNQPLPRDLRPDVLQFLHEYLGIAAHGLPLAPPAASPRIEESLNGGWRFFPHDSDRGADTGFDDTAWEAVQLPHTWNAKDGEDGGNNYRRGAAWYRRHVTIDDRLKGKQLYLQFDGACFQADVYVNGKKLGSHLGGFARFRFDATDALQPGDNLLAVRVDNSPLGIPPVSADFTFFGGLYREVSLVATDPVQISMMDYGSPGMFVDQTDVSAERADMLVRTEVENYEDKMRTVDVETVIRDAEGRPVATGLTRQRMGAGDGFTASQKISLVRPHLWDGTRDPYLYSVEVSLKVEGKVRDRVTQPLGLRFFRCDPQQGFILNGHAWDLHGVNRHQDRIDQGWAISQADEAEDFALVRELGCTAIRASHYQQADTWYQRCDRTGIVVWAEIPFVNQALPTKEFRTNAEDQLRELIRQNYNHPSICFWSVGNETRDVSADTKGSVSNRVVEDLAELAKAEDATRLSTLAANGKENEAKNWHTDVVAFNHYAGWYQPDPHRYGAYLDDIHAKHPQSPIGVSEYGAGASIYQHELPPIRPQINHGKVHPEEYQAYLHEIAWQTLKERPYLWGKFLWCMFDFASDGRDEGDQNGRNDKGLVTYDRRVRKDAYYFYKASWSSEPVVEVTSRRFLIRHRPKTDIKVYANTGRVELTLNGKSLGVQEGPGPVFVWKEVTLRPGENNVSATANFGPEEMTDGCTWIYRPVAPRPPKPAGAGNTPERPSMAPNASSVPSTPPPSSKP